MSKYLNLASIKSWFSDQYQKRPYVILGVGAAIALLIVFLVAMAAIRGFTPNTQRSASPATEVPTSLATPTIIAAIIPTSTPVPSNIWVVSEDLGIMKIGGYRSLVVALRNTTTGEVLYGQCQSPRDPRPLVGDTYILVHTGYYDVNGKDVVFAPNVVSVKQKDGSYIQVQQDINSKFQRFIPVTLP